MLGSFPREALCRQAVRQHSQEVVDSLGGIDFQTPRQEIGELLTRAWVRPDNHPTDQLIDSHAWRHTHGFSAERQGETQPKGNHPPIPSVSHKECIASEDVNPRFLNYILETERECFFTAQILERRINFTSRVNQSNPIPLEFS
jgi:hypothetical protein